MKNQTTCTLFIALMLALASASAALAADAENPPPPEQAGRTPLTVPSDNGKAAALREQMFLETVEDILPITEEQIRSYVRQRDRLDGVIEPGPARMNTQTRRIHATPGAVPQVVRLTAGYSSTLVFQDATGARWPVLSMILGSTKAFEASQPKVEQDVITETQAAQSESVAQAKAKAQVGGQANNVHSNIINIIPLTNHASSNLVVTLEGAPYPLILHLLTESAAKNGRTADALIVFQLDKRGPNANIPQLEPSSPTTVTPEMLSFVHGIAPQGATQVAVEPKMPGITVWEYKSRFYLRTNYAVVWPAWFSVAHGDDMRVYVLPRTPSIVVSISGSHSKLMVGTKK